MPILNLKYFNRCTYTVVFQHKSSTILGFYSTDGFSYSNLLQLVSIPRMSLEEEGYDAEKVAASLESPAAPPTAKTKNRTKKKTARD
jgi:hypothetical protein